MRPRLRFPTTALLLALAAGTIAVPVAEAQERVRVDSARVDPTLRVLERIHRLAPGAVLAAVGAPADPTRERPGMPTEREAPRGERVGPGADEAAWRRLGSSFAVRAPVPGLAAVDPAPGGPYVRTLVRVAGGDASVVERAGGRVHTRAGAIVTATVPLAALPEIAAQPTVRYMEAAASISPDAAVIGPKPLNGRGRAETGVDQIQRRSGERFHGLAGQGVIVGIYDSGIDLSHEDFRRPDGSTRILYAWDQPEAGDAPGAVGPHTFDYGDECDAARIDADACAMEDRLGHGTHVAGTAAGDGSATGNEQPAFRFTGMAPEADLIVVRAGDASTTTDRLVDGVAYIFARAVELGRPAVVNVSLGTQQGPHDGTTLAEQALNALTAPGRVIIASGGNQGTNANESPASLRAPRHAEGKGDGEHRLVVPEYPSREGAINDAAYLEMWYEAEDSLSVTVVSPGGDSAIAATGDTTLVETADGAILIVNAAEGPNPENGDHAAIITIYDQTAGAPPAAGDWTIRVTGDAVHADGEYHLWLVGHNLNTLTEYAYLAGNATNRVLTTLPATADSVIGVAAYATRFRWATADDSLTYPYREPVGDIASFSSPGPRRDGVLTPTIAAPGKFVISARSEDGALWEEFPAFVERDDEHAALLGTSMAAPFVTGAVALLLQIDAELTPAAVRDLLAESARHDAFTAHPYTGDPDGAPNAQWGWGKLDIATAARRLRPRGLVRAGERVNLSENPVRGDRLLINYEERPRRIGVFTFAGEPVRQWSDAEIGDLLSVWDLTTGLGRDVANGGYLLVVEFDDRRVMRKVFVLQP